MTKRTLITGGFVVTQDPELGNLPDADILIENGKITAIARSLADTVVDAEIIDARGTIVVPGFVDTHRHTWETVTRGIYPACSLDYYLGAVVGNLGPAFGPDDVYAGNLIGSLEALNAGITTLLDWSHCNNTPEHADAGVRGLQESGIRAVYAYGNQSGPGIWGWSDVPHPEDARRVRSQYFSSDDSLLTFALALRGPLMTTPEVTASDWKLAEDLDARISMHAGMRITGLHGQAVQELSNAGLLNSKTTYIHANTQTDEELGLIARSGGSVSIAPYVELIMGHGRPPIGRCVAAGITPSLSTDVATTVPGDMFTQMRTALAYERILAFGDDVDLPFAPTLTHVDVLGFATQAGADACGLGDRVGSLAVGKDADIVLIRADAINTMPVVDPIGAVVTSADTSNVDTVLVRGVVKKRHGKLVGVDLAKLNELAISSRDRVLASAGAIPEWLSTQLA